jgi:hypothetical protein
VFLYLEEASFVVDSMKTLQRRIKDVEVIGIGNVLDLAKLDWYAFGVEHCSIMGRAELLTMSFDQIAGVHYVLLLLAPLEGVVEVVEFVLVIEL